MSSMIWSKREAAEKYSPSKPLRIVRARLASVASPPVASLSSFSSMLVTLVCTGDSVSVRQGVKKSKQAYHEQVDRIRGSLERRAPPWVLEKTRVELTMPSTDELYSSNENGSADVRELLAPARVVVRGCSCQSI